MNNETSHKPYFTPNEVAQLLMVSPVTVRQWAHRGWLKAEMTAGGHRRFLRNEVERFAQERGLTLQHADEGALRILVVDDDIQVTGFLIELLSGVIEGISTETAHDGFDAGQKVHAFKPHLILLDLMMPGLDGFTVCKKLKQNPKTQGIRIIGMTGYHTKENVNQIIQTGAEACLAKPIDVQQLLQVIGDTSAHTPTKAVI